MVDASDTLHYSAFGGQAEHWERALRERDERYGAEPSEPARAAAAAFEEAGLRDVLELGAGQGRDTLFFAARDMTVHALDFAPRAVEAITAKAESAGLAQRINASRHDVRHPLPFAAESFDACYSHMLFCMALRESELFSLTTEICRVLRPGGLNVYTVRTTRDPDYGRGAHHGERLYELDAFVVHFFGRDTVERIADGFEIIAMDEFEEGALPRRLYRVTERKPPISRA